MVENIESRLNKARINFPSYQWEAGCKGLYDSIKSYNDLKKVILDSDVNNKIFAMSNILPEISCLFSENERKDLIQILGTQLADRRQCEIVYGGSYSDDADDSSVSISARGALKYLEEKNVLLA